MVWWWRIKILTETYTFIHALTIFYITLLILHRSMTALLSILASKINTYRFPNVMFLKEYKCNSISSQQFILLPTSVMAGSLPRHFGILSYVEFCLWNLYRWAGIRSQPRFSSILSKSWITASKILCSFSENGSLQHSSK